MDEPTKVFLAVILLIIGLCVAPAASNYLMVGRKVTITGTIQLHQLQDDWVIGKNTDMELRTYSGDTHHVELLGHHEFELYKTYRITFKWVVLWGGYIKTGKLLKVEELEASS